MRFLLTFLMIAVVASAQQSSPQDSTALLATAHKLIVVTSTGWNEVNGQMTRYERHGKGWKKIAGPIAVVGGKNGMAWDDHFLARPQHTSDPIKHEGDGRSPAGVFGISHTFGFAPKITSGDFYLPLTPTTECVDDVQSTHYNTIVDRMHTKDVDWNSSEKMRQIEGYRYGAVVAYNDPTTAGRGSCIFLHVWSAPGAGTAGCTAMPEADAQGLLRWLDEKTVLVQMPQAEYEQVKSQLGTP